MTAKRIKQQGVALVLVLWMLSLMTIMAGSFALTMRRQTATVEAIKNNAQALAQAESGIALAETMLLLPDRNKRWRADGNIYQINYANSLNGADSKVRIRLFSETGKIDINMAGQALLQGLIAHAPVEDDQRTKLVSAIMDWRDEDDLVNIEGAEQKQYKQAGLSYQPRNKPFQSIEELQLVLGVTEDAYKWLEPLITVNSGRQQVDLLQASTEVLQVLPDIDTGKIDSILSARVHNAGQGVSDPAAQDGLQQSAAADANTFTVVSEAQLDNGASALLSVMIARSQGNPAAPFQILKWQRNPAGLASLFTEEMTQILVAEYAEPEFNR